jgi:hypothetical protein
MQRACSDEPSESGKKKEKEKHRQSAADARIQSIGVAPQRNAECNTENEWVGALAWQASSSLHPHACIRTDGVCVCVGVNTCFSKVVGRGGGGQGVCACCLHRTGLGNGVNGRHAGSSSTVAAKGPG